jgi:hypothetical protein
VGCWPCIFANKKEIKLIADIDPARIDRIRALEERVRSGARARYERDRAAWPDKEPAQPHHSAGHEANDKWWEDHWAWRSKGKRLQKPFQGPAWFQQKNALPDGSYPMTPIDTAVQWSRTSRGGKQFEMFAAAPGDAGCMRWGLCDTGSDAKDDK